MCVEGTLWLEYFEFKDMEKREHYVDCECINASCTAAPTDMNSTWISTVAGTSMPQKIFRNSTHNATTQNITRFIVVSCMSFFFWISPAPWPMSCTSPTAKPRQRRRSLIKLPAHNWNAVEIRDYLAVDMEPIIGRAAGPGHRVG